MCVLVVLLHVRFSVVGPIPFLLAAIFFRVIPIVGLCLWAGSYDQNWQFMEVNAYVLLWKQHTIGVYFSICYARLSNRRWLLFMGDIKKEAFSPLFWKLKGMYEARRY